MSGRVEQYPNLAHHTGGEDRGGSERRDPAVREESDLVATGSGAYLDEGIGQRFEWRDPGADGKRSLRWGVLAAAGAALTGAIVLRRLRRR